MTEARQVPWVSLTSGSTLATPGSSSAPPVQDIPATGQTGVAGDRSGSGLGAVREHADPKQPVELPVTEPEASQQASPRRGEHLRRRLVVSDCFALCLSWILLGMVLRNPPTPFLSQALLGLLAVVSTLMAMQCLGLYRSRVCMRRTQELERIVLAALVGAVVLDGVQKYYKVHGPLLAYAICSVVALSIFRWNYRRWLLNCRSQGKYLRRVVLIGANRDAAELWKTLQCEPSLGYEVTAVVGVGTNNPPIRDLPMAWEMSSIPELARSTDANGVLVVPNAISTDQLRTAIDYSIANGLHVQVWPGLEGVGTRRLRMTPLSGEAFFYVEPLVIRRWQSAIKRALDIIGSVFALLVTLPILVVAAILVKLDDHGPILHKQERVGRDGKLFVVYKLRSMVNRAESEAPDLEDLNERDGPLFKSSRDPRVTRVGRFIRGSSIDEIPQLWNVLAGSMSLVGPRPALASETAQFDERLLRRLSMKPGLTGLWQIEARDNPAFNAYRRLDLFYVDNWTLRLDLSILVSTPPIVIHRAYRTFRERST